MQANLRGCRACEECVTGVTYVVNREIRHFFRGLMETTLSGGMRAGVKRGLAVATLVVLWWISCLGFAACLSGPI